MNLLTLTALICAACLLVGLLVAQAVGDLREVAA